MSWEEDFMEHLTQAIELPANASAREEFVVHLTREQYEEFKREWDEMRATGNYLPIPGVLTPPEKE